MIKKSQNVLLFSSASLKKGPAIIEVMKKIVPLDAADFLTDMSTYSFRNAQAVPATKGVFATVLKEYKLVPTSAINREVRKAVDLWRKENPDGGMSRKLKADIKDQILTRLYSQAPVLEHWGWVYVGENFTLVAGLPVQDAEKVYGMLLEKDTTYHGQCVIDLPDMYGQELPLDLKDMTNFLLWMWFVSETQREAGHEFSFFQNGPVSIQLEDGVLSDSTDELMSARYKLFKTEGTLKKIEFWLTVEADPVCGFTLSGTKEEIGFKYFRQISYEENYPEFFLTIEAAMKFMTKLVNIFNIHYNANWAEHSKLINEWLSTAAPACERNHK